MNKFYNREKELRALEEHWNSEKAEFLLLYGRRRIGKTYLLQYFLSKDKPHCYYLSAQSSLQTNLENLARRLIQMDNETGYTVKDLNTLPNILRFAGKLANEKRFALVLDEFQYLVKLDPSIPSQIQAWWDMEGIHSRIFLVLCGSHLGMMQELGGPQAPLFGRFTFRYKLPPMDYRAVSRFYEDSSYSVRDKLLAFGVLGGTPRYHALFNCQISLSENIENQILSSMGLLRNEPEVLMLSSHIRDVSPYNTILGLMANGYTRLNDIRQMAEINSVSRITYLMNNLIQLEWIRKETSFGESSERRSLYRIQDHFIQFWFRFVEHLRSELEFQDSHQVCQQYVEPFLNDYMGFHVFEDICLQFMQIKGTDLLGQGIRKASRYWTRDGSIEIDLIAELADGSHLFGECKWSSSPIGVRVYYKLLEKTEKLSQFDLHEKHYILFSASGFEEEMIQTAHRDGVLLVSAEDLLS